MAGGINQEQACVTLNLCEGIVTCTSRLGQWLNKMNLPVREGVIHPFVWIPIDHDTNGRTGCKDHIGRLAFGPGPVALDAMALSPNFKGLETEITGSLMGPVELRAGSNI